MSDTTKHILKADGLAYSYHKTLVFEDVSFLLDSCKIAFLKGINGSGKSTLLRCLAGWLPCKKGRVTLCGEEYDSTNHHQRRMMYFVPDMPPFYDDLTAEEHVKFVLGANHLQDRMDEAENLLDTFGLYSNRKQYPSSYSRGMREKLALAIAFALRPQLLLLDEPFGSLDDEASYLLAQQIRNLAATGSAILLSVHQATSELLQDVVFSLENKHLLCLDATESSPC